jgi:hypothetical protein
MNSTTEPPKAEDKPSSIQADTVSLPLHHASPAQSGINTASSIAEEMTTKEKNPLTTSGEWVEDGRNDPANQSYGKCSQGADTNHSEATEDPRAPQ